MEKEWLIEFATAILCECDYDISGGEVDPNCGSVYITKNNKTFVVNVMPVEDEEDYNTLEDEEVNALEDEEV